MTINLLMNITRGWFCVDNFEEFVLWWGAGKNGKDMLMVWLRLLFGRYGQVIDAPALCKPIDSSVPQPQIRRLKGKRLAYCSEVGAGATFCADTFKKLADPRGACIQARFLHENDAAFHPTLLLAVAFNDERLFDRVDEALMRRMLSAQFPNFFSFEVTADSPPHHRRVDTRFKDESFVRGHMSGLVFLVMEIYMGLVRGQTDTNIRPRPASIDEHIANLRSENTPHTGPVDPILAFVGRCARTPVELFASRAAAVKHALRDAVPGLTLQQAKIRLTAIGFAEARGRSGISFLGRLPGEAVSTYLVLP